jgi:hypothetical protein
VDIFESARDVGTWNSVAAGHSHTAVCRESGAPAQTVWTVHSLLHPSEETKQERLFMWRCYQVKVKMRYNMGINLEKFGNFHVIIHPWRLQSLAETYSDSWRALLINVVVVLTLVVAIYLHEPSGHSVY